MNREGGSRCHAIFGQKLLKTQHGMGRCAHKLPIMQRVNVLKVFSIKKKSPKLNAASHNNASSSTDPDGLQEHSHSGGHLSHKAPALHRMTPVFFGFPLKRIVRNTIHTYTCRVGESQSYSCLVLEIQMNRWCIYMLNI